MNDDTIKSMNLRGGPEKSRTLVGIKADGTLVVDWYDYSPEAESAFGNEVAYLLFVEAAHKPAILAALQKDNENTPPADTDDPDDALLNLMQARFESYFAVQDWFTANHIPFTKKFDSWA